MTPSPASARLRIRSHARRCRFCTAALAYAHRGGHAVAKMCAKGQAVVEAARKLRQQARAA